MGNDNSSHFWASLLTVPEAGGGCICASCCARFVISREDARHCPDCGSSVIGAEDATLDLLARVGRGAVPQSMVEDLLLHAAHSMNEADQNPDGGDAHGNGTPARILEKLLPAMIVNPDEKESKKHSHSKVCSICLDSCDIHTPMGPSSPVKLPCGHFFHYSCVRKWLERVNSCPLCRTSLKDTPQLCAEGGLDSFPRNRRLTLRELSRARALPQRTLTLARTRIKSSHTSHLHSQTTPRSHRRASRVLHPLSYERNC